MNIVYGAFRIIVGAVFGLLCAITLSPALAAFTPTGGGGNAPLLTVAIVGVSVLLAFFAPSIRRAFGRGFLMLGVCMIALPLSTALLSGRAASEVVSASSVDSQPFAAVGAGIGAMAMTGAAAFIGFILGGIFVITGLILALGGRREVIVMNADVPAVRREPRF